MLQLAPIAFLLVTREPIIGGTSRRTKGLDKEPSLIEIISTRENGKITSLKGSVNRNSPMEIAMRENLS